MTRRNSFLAASLILVLTSESAAQVIVVPPPVILPAPVVFIPGGVGFSYPRRHVTVSGFYGSRITIKVIAPSIFPAQDIDLRGVDLDAVGPEALQPRGNPNVVKIPVPPNKQVLDKIDLVKKVEPPANVELPKKEIHPPPKPAPLPPGAQKPAPPELPPQKLGPLEESSRLTDLGLNAFRSQEYGLAGQRFRQAAEIEPAQSMPYFLLAQAYLALGKYQEAVGAIESGMRLQEDWPLSAFLPRVDLYKGIEDDWLAHKKQLADVQALHANQPVYLFLQAYQWWFDGQREQAILMFERARILAPDNAFIRAFLKVMPKLAAQ